MTNIIVSWNQLKSWYDQSPETRKIRCFDLFDVYKVIVIDDNLSAECSIDKTEEKSDEQLDFENSFLSKCQDKKITEVATQSEKNDKTLRTFCVFNETDGDGISTFCIPVPQPHRWIAYGDIEFEQRHFGDHISAIEIVDHNRLIAWQIALSIDPKSNEPVPDSVVIENGYPLYPIVGHYDEKLAPELQNDPHMIGTIKAGMGMTFQYGLTEAQPIGGYGLLPGGFYLQIKAKKADGLSSGFRCQLSIDWAESNG